MEKNFFTNPDFQDRLDNANKRLKEYLEEKEFILDNIKIEELIQWNDKAGFRQVYPHNNCPDRIKGIVKGIIKNEFKMNDNNLY